MLILSRPDGKPIPAGAHGEVDGKVFIVGYDGRAYVKGLAPENTVVVTTEKDFVRLDPAARTPIVPVPVHAVFSDPAALTPLLDRLVEQRNVGA